MRPCASPPLSPPLRGSTPPAFFGSVNDVVEMPIRQERVADYRMPEGVGGVDRAVTVLTTHSNRITQHGFQLQVLGILERLPDLFWESPVAAETSLFPALIAFACASNVRVELLQQMGDAVALSLLSLPSSKFTNSEAEYTNSEAKITKKEAFGAKMWEFTTSVVEALNTSVVWPAKERWMKAVVLTIPIVPTHVLQLQAHQFILDHSGFNENICIRVQCCHVCCALCEATQTKSTASEGKRVREAIMCVMFSLARDIAKTVRETVCVDLPYICRALTCTEINTQVYPVMVELTTDDDSDVLLSSMRAVATIATNADVNVSDEFKLIPLKYLRGLEQKKLDLSNQDLIFASDVIGPVLWAAKGLYDANELRTFLDFALHMALLDVDVMRLNVAHNTPALSAVVSSDVYQDNTRTSTVLRFKVFSLCDVLAVDEDVTVRRKIAAGLKETSKIATSEDLIGKAVKLLTVLLRDKDTTVVAAAVDSLASFMGVLRDNKSTCAHLSLTCADVFRALFKADVTLGYAWRLRVEIVTVCQDHLHPALFPSRLVFSHLAPFLTETLVAGALPRAVQTAMVKCLCVLYRYTKREDQRNLLMQWIVESLPSGLVYARVLFVQICEEMLTVVSRAHFKHVFLEPLLRLADSELSHGLSLQVLTALLRLPCLIKPTLTLPIDRPHLNSLVSILSTASNTKQIQAIAKAEIENFEAISSNRLWLDDDGRDHAVDARDVEKETAENIFFTSGKNKKDKADSGHNLVALASLTLNPHGQVSKSVSKNRIGGHQALQTSPRPHRRARAVVNGKVTSSDDGYAVTTPHHHHHHQNLYHNHDRDRDRDRDQAREMSRPRSGSEPDIASTMISMSRSAAKQSPVSKLKLKLSRELSSSNGYLDSQSASSTSNKSVKHRTHARARSAVSPHTEAWGNVARFKATTNAGALTRTSSLDNVLTASLHSSPSSCTLSYPQTTTTTTTATPLSSSLSRSQSIGPHSNQMSPFSRQTRTSLSRSVSCSSESESNITASTTANTNNNNNNNNNNNSSSSNSSNNATSATPHFRRVTKSTSDTILETRRSPKSSPRHSYSKKTLANQDSSETLHTLRNNPASQKSRLSYHSHSNKANALPPISTKPKNDKNS